MWKPADQLTLAECENERIALEDYFAMCRESGSGVSSKDVVRHRACSDRLYAVRFALRASYTQHRIVTLPWTATLERDLAEVSEGTATGGTVVEFWGTADCGEEWRVHLDHDTRETWTVAP